MFERQSLLIIVNYLLQLVDDEDRENDGPAETRT